jgi:AcrR family transcriptional regulator
MKTSTDLSLCLIGLLSHHYTKAMGLLSHRYNASMARWEPGARERLVLAAVDLFTEQGYDATTVTEIAARAGVTKSTFFRYFPDKREILVAGQATLGELLARGIAEAPAGATPLEAVVGGLECVSSAMGPMNRELGPRMKAAVAANAELQERDALKRVGLAAAMTAALVERGVPDPTAHLASEMGVLAFKQGFAEWCDADRGADHDLAHYALSALHELRAAASSLG